MKDIAELTKEYFVMQVTRKPPTKGAKILDILSESHLYLKKQEIWVAGSNSRTALPGGVLRARGLAKPPAL